jgi:hypothetical protein
MKAIALFAMRICVNEIASKENHILDFVYTAWVDYDSIGYTGSVFWLVG